MPRGSKKIDKETQNLDTDKEIKTKTVVEDKDDIVKNQKREVKSLPNHTEVILKSNMYGQLIFKNDKNGNRVQWNGLDDSQNLTVEDIRYMKSNQPAFFERNWVKLIGVDDDEYEDLSIEQLYKLLGLSKFYKTKQFTDEFKKFIKLDSYGLGIKIDEMNRNEKTLFKNYIISLKSTYIQKLPYGVIKTLNEKLGLEL